MIPQSKTRRAPVVLPAASQFGVRSDSVRDLQVFLRDLGYPVGEIDGYFGNQTRIAVAMFQEANGIPAHGHWDVVSQDATTVLVAQDRVVPFSE